MSFSRCVASRRLLGWGLALTILLFHAEGKNLRAVTDNNFRPHVFQGPDGLSLGGYPEPAQIRPACSPQPAQRN